MQNFIYTTLILCPIFKPVCQEISNYVRIFFHKLLFVALVYIIGLFHMHI